MREVLSTQGAQRGNQIGAKFWEATDLEHGADPTDLEHVDPEQKLQPSAMWSVEDDDELFNDYGFF